MGAAEGRNAHHTDEIRVIPRGGRQLRIRKLVRYLGERRASDDHEHRATAMLAHCASRGRAGVGSPEHHGCPVQPLDQRRPGLQRPSVVTHVHCVHAPCPAAITKHVRQTLRALFALG